MGNYLPGMKTFSMHQGRVGADLAREMLLLWGERLREVAAKTSCGGVPIAVVE